jgi:hypothetical protein
MLPGLGRQYTIWEREVLLGLLKPGAFLRAPSKLIEAVSGGWPKVISNLKSLLETGSIVLDQPYPTR